MKRRFSKVIAVVLMLTVFLGVSVLSTSAYSVNAYNRYEDQVMSLLYEKYDFLSDDSWSRYEELYSFYDTDNKTPEYVLFHACVTEGDRVTVEVINDYVVAAEHKCFPDELGYFVYVPSDNSVYTLAEASRAEVEDIDAVFESRKIATELIGDADTDRTITVKDATWIQKVEAGYEMIAKYDDYLYSCMEEIVQDFNRDGGVNIKDATAIQKHVAGIEVDYPDNIYDPTNITFSSMISEDADFEEDTIIVATKYGWGHDYTLENFSEYKFSSIRKIGETNGEGYAIYVLYLKEPSRENVIEAVKSLDYRAEIDLESVAPNYIWFVNDAK